MVTWTYSGAPDTTTAAGMRDAVRLLMGDTDTSDQQLTDEAITFLLDQEGDDIYGAAITGIRMLIAKYARKVNSRVGHTMVFASQKVSAYKSLLDTLEARRSSISEVFAGGITVSGKDALSLDTDAVQPSFGISQDDNPGQSTSSTTSEEA